MKTFFRVCNLDTEQGLWYNTDGSFSGLIHDEFNFCQNKDLVMEFDEDVVGWLSAVEKLDDLWCWFTKGDILKLEKHGWFIAEYETDVYKFYDVFSHYLICQNQSRLVKIHKITD